MRKALTIEIWEDENIFESKQYIYELAGLLTGV